MLQNTLLNQKKELTLKTQKITELEEKIKQLENLTINQGAVYMRGSNLYKD
jgi:polyhydroxyalkanoate synthesis regulator phasin